jgi:hypothetical protein
MVGKEILHRLLVGRYSYRRIVGRYFLHGCPTIGRQVYFRPTCGQPWADARETENLSAKMAQSTKISLFIFVQLQTLLAQTAPKFSPKSASRALSAATLTRSLRRRAFELSPSIGQRGRRLSQSSSSAGEAAAASPGRPPVPPSIAAAQSISAGRCSLRPTVIPERPVRLLRPHTLPRPAPFVRDEAPQAVFSRSPSGDATT